MIDIACIDGEAFSFDLLDALPWPGRGRDRASARHRRWRRLLVGNPFADGRHRPLVWVAQAGNRPVGCLFGVPLHARGDGLLVRGHWGVDLMVHPDFRGRGVGRRLLEHWRDATPLALGLGITDSAFRIETALGWHPVTLPSRLVLPLSARGTALTRAWTPRWLRSRTHSTRHGFDVVVSTEMPQGVDHVYRRIASNWPWHVCRYEAELVRRYVDRRPEGFLWVSLWTRRRLEALAVVKIHRNRVRRKMWLYELLTETAGAAFDRLVETCLDLGKSLDVDLLEARVTDPGLRSALFALGFVEGGPEDRFIVHARGKDLEARTPWRQAWTLSLGDSGNL